MALVIRYFKTAATGTGDGTSAANAAALFTGGAWSTVITGFNFAGTDGLEARVLPGTYTPTVALGSSSFANPPTTANPLVLHGCDAAGNLLSPPPSTRWTSDQPAWDDSSLPVIAVTTNIVTVNLNQGIAFARLLKFTSSNAATNQVVTANLDWCVVVNSTSASGALGVSGIISATNTVVKMTGTAYTYAVNINGTTLNNLRIEGNVAATTGNRDGFVEGSNATRILNYCTIVNHPGVGIRDTSNQTGAVLRADHCVVANCGTGIQLPSTAGLTGGYYVDGCCITGCTTGINAGAARLVARNNRLRNTTNYTPSSAFNAVYYDAYTTAGTDAADYYNAAGGDYRIKDTTLIAKGVGVSAVQSLSYATAG